MLFLHCLQIHSNSFIQHEEFPYAFDLVGRLESVACDAPPRQPQRVARLTMTSTHYPPLYGTVWDNPL